ncbi:MULTISPECIES: radical SAM/SPASM domain-containing protein [Laceyella]|uniref:Radical SAM protein with 4Fe4S-binding SPASM domain n=1 Tax=Laceyella sediminis TaxID=573074 RepID=A0ABX5EMR4_9BACL|nr:radical SAM protein [Laceyella sediminis]PRZ13609.1 radical SAM protein with 4Fe4S-binding SPASM domain [Laceyella sediminis]
MVLQKKDLVRLREEPFGSFIYFRKSQSVARLNHLETLIVKSFEVPRDKKQVAKVIASELSCLPSRVEEIVQNLSDNFVLKEKKGDGIPFSAGDWRQLCEEQERIAMEKPFSSPVWMHIQPWTICNLKCEHCYCFASPQGVPSHLSEDDWYRLIDDFAELNVFEMFITGGEVFIDERFWKLSAYARKKDMVIRTTTNGTLIKEDTPDRLVEELGIDKIQVSLDGASPETHDAFRGKSGAFVKTVKGIRQLRSRMDVSLEVTIHNKNFHEVDQIVRLASELGCCEVKFVNIFPTGRGYGVFHQYQLSFDQKYYLIDRYQVLQDQYPHIRINYGSNCNDITQKDSSICTAGVVGANVDERGNVLPCIMGISIPSLYAGNVLEQRFPDIWYHSSVLKRMRHLPDQTGASCGSCNWRVECKSRCSVIAHTTAQDPCHLSPANPVSHFNKPIEEINS